MERKFLASFGLDKDAIDRVLGRHSSEIGTQKQALAALAAERDGFRLSAQTYRRKAERAAQDAAAKIADMRFQCALDNAITFAKGRNARAIKALLDIDGLRASKTQSMDIGKALKVLKTESAYLFDAQTPPHAAGAGSAPTRTAAARRKISRCGTRRIPKRPRYGRFCKCMAAERQADHDPT